MCWEEALLVAMPTKAFPRGGGRGDGGGGGAAAAAAAATDAGAASKPSVDTDFLFRAPKTKGAKGKGKDAGTGKKAGKKTTKKLKGVGSDGQPLRHQPADEADRKEAATKLTFETVKVGTVFLGLITRVFRRKLVVSLPHQLMGYVELEETSDRLFNIYEEEDADSTAARLHDKKADNLELLFAAGQYVTCVAIELEQVGKKRVVQLSLRPRLTGAELTVATIVPGAPLQGEVVSVEDYGYRLGLGPPGVRGFLPFAKAHGDNGGGGSSSSSEEEERFPVGKIVQTMVESVNKGSKVVTVRRFGAGDAALAVPKRNLNTTFRALKPGMLVEAHVVRVLSNGVKAVFLRSFEASAQKLHLRRCAGARAIRSAELIAAAA